MNNRKPIGVFDSGYGGLSVYRDIQSLLPSYDYVYLGDNARVPYGNRSFETVYEYTWQSVRYLLDHHDCPLVIVACNTASAKALRTIQQVNLPTSHPNRKVLGVIRPTTEIVGTFSNSQNIGIFATKGTVLSQSYTIEIQRFFPDINVFQQACPLWVPLIENKEHLDQGADYFVKKYCDALLAQSDKIDTVVLGCTHYPLLINKISKYLPKHVKIISQGPIVAKSLKEYLYRHGEIDQILSRNETSLFLTTDNSVAFDEQALLFLQKSISSESVHIDF